MKNSVTHTAASAKRNKSRAGTNRSPMSLNRKDHELEKMLAKRILMRTERREPKTRVRNPSFHQTLANSMGLRSFKGKQYSSVLSENSMVRAMRGVVPFE